MSKKAVPIKAIEAEKDLWETGDLGRSLDHAEVSDDEGEDAAIDKAMSLRPISIRLEQHIIDAFRFIASRNKNIGYQTLMRQCLKRFVTAELKLIANQMAAEEEATERAKKECEAANKGTAAA